MTGADNEADTFGVYGHTLQERRFNARTAQISCPKAVRVKEGKSV